jgi:thymidylate synthase (FAD)
MSLKMKIELLEIFGNDEMVVNAARVSYGKDATNYTSGENKSLINYLASHGHTSPFRHPQLQYRITCPIYVERQLFKHQIGLSANSISGRYVDFSDTYTKVNVWRKQSKSSKQGSEGMLFTDVAEKAKFIEEQMIDHAKRAYHTLIELGVSKEQARTILPLNLNTTFIWTGSLYAYINMFKQRIDRHAQAETREVAMEMLHQLKLTNNFNLSLEAFHL